MFVPSVKFFFLADLGNIIAFECGINVFFGISIKKNEKKMSNVSQRAVEE